MEESNNSIGETDINMIFISTSGLSLRKIVHQVLDAEIMTSKT